MRRDESLSDEAADLRQYFEHFAKCSQLESVPLPSAGLIWWRAQLAAKQKLARRSVLAIDAALLAAIILSSALMFVLTFIWSPGVLSALSLPVPVTIFGLVLFTASTGCILLAWARQR